MDKLLKDKLNALEELLKDFGRVAIAFSGGVDSTFLLKASADILGKDNVIAVTASSSFIPDDELEDARQVANSLGIEHIIIELDVLGVDEITKNPKNRCYICKRLVFNEIINTANNEGITAILDGTNADDTGDFRPGMKALEELGVVSPLKEIGFTKKEIREVSKEWNLNTWDKPSLACLASRIPYNEIIDETKLKTVEKGEKYLRSLGFKQLRVRHHGEIVRVELSPDEMRKIFDIDLMKQVDEYFKKLGFKYATLDFLGYRTGSLN